MTNLLSLSVRLWVLCAISAAQQTPHIVLEQGALEGLKIFPDATRTAVFAFLGVPYAEPPVGELRFASPRPHLGWNSTLHAMNMRPICPQLSNTVFDETSDGVLARSAQMDENCLYLNIWVPEVVGDYGNLPVLVVITGEHMSYDWPRNRVTGLDFALEGVIVVTVQYRQNIFGWIGLNSRDLPGNYGLQDQRLALQWIHRNIPQFGGDPNQVTLLGHGSSGAPCALALTLLHYNEPQLYHRLVLMSGGDLWSTLNAEDDVWNATKTLVRKLGCHFEKRTQLIVSCLRAKSVSDLLNAYESIYEHDNGTFQLGAMLPEQFREIYTTDSYRIRPTLPSILLGITSNEGAFYADYWTDLARQGYVPTRSYVNYTILPKALRMAYLYDVDDSAVLQALNWRYFNAEAAHEVSHLLYAMQRLISESAHEAPYFATLQQLAAWQQQRNTSSIYAYVFQLSNSMDMRGKLNLYGGAGHASDLPFLFGPSLYQQIARRRFAAKEEQLCREMRAKFVNFIKTGNPTPGRIYDGWLPYTGNRKFIYALGEKLSPSQAAGYAYARNEFDAQLQQIEQLLDAKLGTAYTPIVQTPYQRAFNSNRRGGKAVPYQVNPYDSGYAMHLQNVYDFWHMLLPHMTQSGPLGAPKDPLSQGARLMEASANAARYKQGFFIMLSLVALLLVLLSMCVYLLRRDSCQLSPGSPGCSL